MRVKSVGARNPLEAALTGFTRRQGQTPQIVVVIPAGNRDLAVRSHGQIGFYAGPKSELAGRAIEREFGRLSPNFLMYSRDCPEQ